MLIQILSHTPAYVWAILALLVWRGTSAMREREVSVRKLCIMPLLMLLLSLQDIAARFGSGPSEIAGWMAGAGIGMLLAWRFGGVRVGPGSMPGSVRVAGSPLPLIMMLAVFFTKYLASVLLAVQPGLRRDTLFAAAVCGLFGVFNGWFGGRLARDLRAVSAAGLQRAAV